ncbi:MAG: hypothetical protein JWO05_995 [Gemmatimonadetes bacterium]|nr:hypothetical protein [Gemmatimonadota bacterium]
MRRFRPVFALLSMISMLHLSVGAAKAAACESAPASASQAGSMGAHGMHMAVPANASQKAGSAAQAAPERCEHPAQSSCCEAMAGCGGATVVADQVAVTEQPATQATRVIAAHYHAPESFAAAPEPPPPKA